MVKAIFIRYQSPLEEELCLKILKNIQILKLLDFYSVILLL